MIYIDIYNQDYYDDAAVLIKSFYPRTDVMLKRPSIVLKEEDIVITIDIDTFEIVGLEKKEAHDCFKKKLYLKLCERTGKTLPWGYLTGVRPSKIAYAMLEDGIDDSAISKRFTKEYLAKESKAALAIRVAKTEKSILEDMDYKQGYSLYIGIPFCPTTCLYCSFTSYSLEAYGSKVDVYLDALIKEMAYVAEAMSGQRLDTVYFGGGTPTTLSPAQLDRLLTELEQRFDMSAVRELTVEAGRPDSITMEKLQVLKRHNVDRISINPQSMNDSTLEIIGRKHTVAQVVEAFKTARAAGFDNINMDIILGLPGENANMVENTLKQISELKPESLTVHSLAIKRAAALNIWREKYSSMKIENSDDTVQMAADYAAAMGLEPYYMYRQKNMAGNLENVGYAKPGTECIYNILIMEEKQTIVALGAGSSTKRVYPYGRIERCENVKDVAVYMDRIGEMIERKRILLED